MALGTRLEAIAFRLTMLVAVACLLLAGLAVWITRGAAAHSEAMAALGDSVYAIDTLGCGPSGTDARAGLYCDSASLAWVVDASKTTHEIARGDRDRLTMAIAWLVILPPLVFGVFYVIRWLFTGRLTPLWPVRERQARSVAAADEGTSRRAP